MEMTYIGSSSSTSSGAFRPFMSSYCTIRHLPSLSPGRRAPQLAQRFPVFPLLGRQVVCVLGFPPKRIAGFASEVLVLGALSEAHGVVLLGPDDGRSPVLRLDSVGRHTVAAGSVQQHIVEALVQAPLDRLGLRFADIDKYATELHNPEITDTAGSGDVPRTNYRLIAALAARRGEIPAGSEARDRFIAEHGMPGFSPTQGHVASAMPYIAHALDGLRAGELRRTMFLAKGSLFLGRMTHLADGESFILEANPA
ncbi:MAG: DUF5940 domain-containing protein [Dehalococcoidia bacterium]|nr:DUF5940 domain-containing protein [Dehalococcoidia bacterium]